MKRWASILIVALLCTLWLPVVAAAQGEMRPHAGLQTDSTISESADDPDRISDPALDSQADEDLDQTEDTSEMELPQNPVDQDDGIGLPDPDDPGETPDDELDISDPITDEKPDDPDDEILEPVGEDQSTIQDDPDADDPDDEDPPPGRIILPEEGFLYTADDFYTKAQELVAAYPDLLRMDVLGYSADGRPVFVIIMAEGIAVRSYEELYIQRHQLFLEAGTHSRETINSYLLIRTVEDYCMDVTDNTHMPEINVASILKKGTFHFLILSNPDGYDAVKHGPDAIRSSTLRQKLIQLLNGRSITLLKAGIEGVDRNRNFTDEYYNVSTKKWVNQFYTNNVDSPQQPALENYPGPHPASAAETKMLENYMQRYPFRAFLSYHSRGQAVFYVKEYLSTTYNQNVLRPFAEMAGTVTGYRVIHTVSSTTGAGYLSHFAVNMTQKPALTIETTPVSSFPTPYQYYEEEYERVRLLPYRAMEYAVQKGYFPYHVYVGGKFFQDYQSQTYARGVAEKLLGRVVNRSGTPIYEYIVVFSDGKKIPFSAGSGAPFIENNRSMLPVRRVAEFLGANVDWNQSLYQAEITWDDQKIEIPINKSYIVVNGKKITMDTTNMLEYNRTYVPLRYVFQGMGYQVSWTMEGGQHLIQINSPQS